MDIKTASVPSSVPSKVKNIHVSNSGDSSSLKVSWTPGQGDVDGYSVFLYRQDRQLDVRPVSKHQNEVTFGSLQPGQMYSVTVQSLSGELLNNNTAAGRTGETSRLYTAENTCLIVLHSTLYNPCVCVFSALSCLGSPAGGPALHLQPAGELAGGSGCVRWIRPSASR